jgi:hypothetical protein
VRLHAQQHVREVRHRVHLVRLACRDERVEAGQVLACLIVPDEEEVLPPQGGDPEGALGGVMPRARLCRASGRERRRCSVSEDGAVGNAA